jgi:hypothetical protein
VRRQMHIMSPQPLFLDQIKLISRARSRAACDSIELFSLYTPKPNDVNSPFDGFLIKKSRRPVCVARCSARWISLISCRPLRVSVRPWPQERACCCMQMSVRPADASSTYAATQKLVTSTPQITLSSLQ